MMDGYAVEVDIVRKTLFSGYGKAKGVLGTVAFVH